MGVQVVLRLCLDERPQGGEVAKFQPGRRLIDDPLDHTSDRAHEEGIQFILRWGNGVEAETAPRRRRHDHANAINAVPVHYLVCILATSPEPRGRKARSGIDACAFRDRRSIGTVQPEDGQRLRVAFAWNGEDPRFRDSCLQASHPKHHEPH